MAQQTVNLSCTCGQVTARLDKITPRSGTHVRCYCADCRAFLRALQPQTPVLDGADIFQLAPEQIDIISGRDKLACLTLSKKGLYRWYAACCDTPMFNSSRNPALAFASIVTDVADRQDAFGPVVTQAFIRKADGSQGHKGVFTMVMRLFSRMISTRLSGRWKDNPFFSFPARTPISPPRRLTDAERKAAYDT